MTHLGSAGTAARAVWTVLVTMVLAGACVLAVASGAPAQPAFQAPPVL